ncbi:IS1 family transposase [Leptolyngbya subtilissima DQ-A4]|uniref:IS1 family transposase n=1 Tax=Leptolyngbya subtilissima DQ-A4 TaxID=2933933 RepID=A0ABV0JZK9_9CYAN
MLAYVLAPHEDVSLSALMTLLTPFGIQQFYTDRWGTYLRLLKPEHHTVSKMNTQRIERKHLTLRTRIKRLARKTICFSKSVLMHDTVIGLFINRFEFGRPI